VVFAASAADGVKVAMWPVALSTEIVAAVTGTRPGAGPTTVKFTALTVSGSRRRPEGTLNVAFTVALGQTAVAAAAGLVDRTVIAPGAATAPVVKVQMYALAAGSAAWLPASVLPARSRAAVLMVAVYVCAAASGNVGTKTTVLLPAE
jgi:hypothetical protein